MYSRTNVKVVHIITILLSTNSVKEITSQYYFLIRGCVNNVDFLGKHVLSRNLLLLYRATSETCGYLILLSFIHSVLTTFIIMNRLNDTNRYFNDNGPRINSPAYVCQYFLTAYISIFLQVQSIWPYDFIRSHEVQDFLLRFNALAFGESKP